MKLEMMLDEEDEKGKYCPSYLNIANNNISTVHLVAMVACVEALITKQKHEGGPPIDDSAHA